jgi:hypothetical protein
VQQAKALIVATTIGDICYSFKEVLNYLLWYHRNLLQAVHGLNGQTIVATAIEQSYSKSQPHETCEITKFCRHIK